MPYVESSGSGKKRKRRSSSSRSRSSSRPSSSKSTSKSKSSSTRAKSKGKIREAKAPQFSVYSSLVNRVTPGSKPTPLSAKEKVLLYVAGFTCIIIISLVVLAWNSRSAPMLEWADETQLPAMTDSAMGVSSEAAPESDAYIEPFMCRGHAKFTLDALYEMLHADKETFRYVRRENNQVQAVAVTPGLGYNNDLIFQARTNPERIEIYGTARISVGDFGANRDYLEDVRERLREEHVLK